MPPVPGQSAQLVVFDRAKIFEYNLCVALVRERLGKDGAQMFVHLERDHPLCPVGKRARQSPRARAYLEYDVPVRNSRVLGDRGKQVGVGQKILTESLVKAEPVPFEDVRYPIH